MSRIVAVTQHPASPAHGAMAMAALSKMGEALGHAVQVERWDGPPLPAAAIQGADVLVLVSDRPADASRFQGKPQYVTTSSRAIRETKAVLEGALALVSGPRSVRP